MTHSEGVETLKGDLGTKIIKDLCLYSPTIRKRYSDIFVRFWFLKEFIVRFDKGLIYPDGRFVKTIRRLDALIIVQPSLSSQVQNWTFKIGFEVKVNLDDLLRDNKIPYYLGWTDFFFLAVDDALLTTAMEKAAKDPRIGVVSLRNGIIHKYPAWQDIPTGRRYAVMEQAFFGYAGSKDIVNCFKM